MVVALNQPALKQPVLHMDKECSVCFSISYFSCQCMAAGEKIECQTLASLKIVGCSGSQLSITAANIGLSFQMRKE